MHRGYVAVVSFLCALPNQAAGICACTILCSASDNVCGRSCLQQLQALGDTVGVVSRGAAPDVMARLRKCTYAEHNPDHERCNEQ